VELFFILLILLVVTRTFGEIAERLGQPGLVGELIAGIVLGTIAAQQTDLLPEIAGLADNPVFDAVTDLGMFFIMLYAGVELQPGRLVAQAKGAISVAIGGMILPLCLGLLLAWYWFPSSEGLFAQSIFLGTALAITAVPATVRILIDLGRLDTPSGQIIVSAAVFDDILSLVLLAWLTALMESAPGEVFEFWPILIKVLAFFIITTVIGVFVFPFGGRFLIRFREREFEFSALLVGAFAFSVLAELLELHFIVGAFMAGLFFGRKTISEAAFEDVRNKTSAMTFGFLAPIFFASVGLNLNFSALLETPMFVLMLLVAAFTGKFLGAGLAARLAGLSNHDAAAVGVGMSARGAVELVIADIALEAGLFDINPGDTESAVISHLFSAVILMAVVTTLLTPILLKRIYSHEQATRDPPA